MEYETDGRGEMGEGISSEGGVSSEGGGMSADREERKLKEAGKHQGNEDVSASS